ncbi:MAG: hypothetical protein IPG53_02800 [Ignavibacteriales bacterium]|nr:hypothetical protein [Ignavibacteriales bacterium]
MPTPTHSSPSKTATSSPVDREKLSIATLFSMIVYGRPVGITGLKYPVNPLP